MEPRYQVNKIPNMDVNDNGDPVDDGGWLWEVMRQYDGPWGTVQVARFKTRREARAYARRMNAMLE
jgi:hypothetical protein